ncbi:hypothetical protein [Streptomyces sp. NPDC002172]
MITAGHSADRTAQRHAHLVLAVGAVAFVCTVVMAGGTLTIPLYVLWASQFGFGPLTTVVVFIAYVVGVVGTPLVAGSLSDAVGRRPVLALSLALTALSTLGSAPADDLTVLLPGFADQAVGTRVSSTMLAALVVSTSLVGLVLGRRTGSTIPPDTFSRPSTHLTPVEENHERNRRRPPRLRQPGPRPAAARPGGFHPPLGRRGRRPAARG